MKVDIRASLIFQHSSAIDWMKLFVVETCIISVLDDRMMCLNSSED